MQYLKDHPEIKHGKIRIAFTPDEEIGQGADHFDVEKFGCDWGYTIDGGQIGGWNMRISMPPALKLSSRA